LLYTCTVREICSSDSPCDAYSSDRCGMPMPKKLEDVDQDDDGGVDSQLRPEEAQKQFSLTKFMFGEGGKTVHQRREEIEHTRMVQMFSLFPWPGADRLPCVHCGCLCYECLCFITKRPSCTVLCAKVSKTFASFPRHSTTRRLEQRSSLLCQSSWKRTRQRRERICWKIKASQNS
jgi:hypothetical protein